MRRTILTIGALVALVTITKAGEREDRALIQQTQKREDAERESSNNRMMRGFLFEADAKIAVEAALNGGDDVITTVTDNRLTVDCMKLVLTDNLEYVIRRTGPGEYTGGIEHASGLASRNVVAEKAQFAARSLAVAALLRFPEYPVFYCTITAKNGHWTATASRSEFRDNRAIKVELDHRSAEFIRRGWR